MTEGRINRLKLRPKASAQDQPVGASRVRVGHCRWSGCARSGGHPGV